jgi:hypothetical protein
MDARCCDECSSCVAQRKWMHAMQGRRRRRRRRLPSLTSFGPRDAAAPSLTRTAQTRASPSPGPWLAFCAGAECARSLCNARPCDLPSDCLYRLTLLVLLVLFRPPRQSLALLTVVRPSLSGPSRRFLSQPFFAGKCACSSLQRSRTSAPPSPQAPLPARAIVRTFTAANNCFPPTVYRHFDSLSYLELGTLSTPLHLHLRLHPLNRSLSHLIYPPLPPQS